MDGGLVNGWGIAMAGEEIDMASRRSGRLG